MTTESIIIIISIIIYGVVFFIQRSQIAKQNELFSKYEKIFTIINIDEIEKYIQMQKKSLELSIKNREVDLQNNEISLQTKIKAVKDILKDSETNLANSSEISEKIDNILVSAKSFLTKTTELNIAEFSELHSTVKNILEKDHPLLWADIEPQMITIVNKYENQKKVVLEMHGPKD